MPIINTSDKVHKLDFFPNEKITIIFSLLQEIYTSSTIQISQQLLEQIIQLSRADVDTSVTIRDLITARNMLLQKPEGLDTIFYEGTLTPRTMTTPNSNLEIYEGTLTYNAYPESKPIPFQSQATLYYNPQTSWALLELYSYTM
jgi:hypothetical protein